SLHKYLYCESSPSNGKDPSGHGDGTGTYAGLGAAITIGLILAAATVASINEAQNHAIGNLGIALSLAIYKATVGEAAVAEAEAGTSRPPSSEPEVKQRIIDIVPTLTQKEPQQDPDLVFLHG